MSSLEQNHMSLLSLKTGQGRVRRGSSIRWPASVTHGANYPNGSALAPSPMADSSVVRRRQVSAANSRNRRRIEQREGVGELPMLRPGAPSTARHVEHRVEKLPAELLDGRLAGRDPA